MRRWFGAGAISAGGSEAEQFRLSPCNIYTDGAAEKQNAVWKGLLVGGKKHSGPDRPGLSCILTLLIIFLVGIQLTWTILSLRQEWNIYDGVVSCINPVGLLNADLLQPHSWAVLWIISLHGESWMVRPSRQTLCVQRQLASSHCACHFCLLSLCNTAPWVHPVKDNKVRQEILMLMRIFLSNGSQFGFRPLQQAATGWQLPVAPAHRTSSAVSNQASCAQLYFSTPTKQNNSWSEGNDSFNVRSQSPKLNKALNIWGFTSD